MTRTEYHQARKLESELVDSGYQFLLAVFVDGVDNRTKIEERSTLFKPETPDEARAHYEFGQACEIHRLHGFRLVKYSQHKMKMPKFEP